MSDKPKKTVTNVVRLENVRLAFPELFVAKQVNGEGTARYSAALIMDPNHSGLAALERVFKVVAKEKWGDEAEETLTLLKKKDKLALHDGDDKPNYEGYPGNHFVNANSTSRPTVVDKDRSALIEGDGVIYSGCYVNAIIEIWAQDNKYGKRINATLKGVQFYAKGDAFSGSPPAQADDFDDLSVAEDGGDDLAA